MFSVNEGSQTAVTLSFGHDVQRRRGLTARLRSVDLDDPPTRDSADA